MGLEKAIEHEKEKRKPYKGSKAICTACRNHGSDDWGLGNRIHRYRKRQATAEQKEKEFNSRIEELEYKGYYGTVEFSDTDNIFFGKVVGINSLVSFEGDDMQTLKEDFEGAVDDYLEVYGGKEL